MITLLENDTYKLAFMRHDTRMLNVGEAVCAWIGVNDIDYLLMSLAHASARGDYKRLDELGFADLYVELPDRRFPALGSALRHMLNQGHVWQKASFSRFVRYLQSMLSRLRLKH
ncbi:MAG TPA: hypothetical protein VFZ48_01110 [Candidatus Saccharimonadales bacterium]